MLFLQGLKVVKWFQHITIISNMFISASLSETQGLTYIEAMASSIPVIARYDDQLEDVIDDGKMAFSLKMKMNYQNLY